MASYDIDYVAAAIELMLDHPPWLIEKNRQATPAESLELQIEDFGCQLLKDACGSSRSLWQKIHTISPDIGEELK